MNNNSDKVQDFLVRLTQIEQLNKEGLSDKVISLCQENLQVAKALKSHLLLGYCFFIMTDVYKEKGQAEKAVTLLNHAYSSLSQADSEHEVLDKITSDSLKITALVGIAFTALQLQEPKKALVVLKVLKTNLRDLAVASSNMAHSQERELDPLLSSWIAWAYNQQGDSKKALQMINHASKVLKESQDSSSLFDDFLAPSKISVLWQKGVTYGSLSHKKEGKKLCQVALKLAQDNHQQDYVNLIKKSLVSFD